MLRALTVATILSIPMLPTQGDAQELPPDSAITAIIRDRVDAGWTPGIVVGVIRPDGSRKVYSEGLAPDGSRLNDRSVFEIGSITKAFTGILLAEMAARGEVRLDEPVAALLPAGTRVPEWNGKVITLLDLSTQSSGLPRLPGNMPFADPTNPYADYTDSLLFDFLSMYTLTRDIGAEYEYSNLGVGLLGNALARRRGTTYEALVTERVLAPLRMSDTRVTLSPDMRSRLAQGHGAEGEPAANWDLPALAGAGALRSTAQDMLSFLAANIGGRVDGPLGSALASAREPRKPAGSPALRIGLGWHILSRGGRDIVWHNGGTGGYRSFAGFDPVRKIGVIVLTNSANDSDDIGFHLLDSANPLVSSRGGRPVNVPELVLKDYEGEYKLAPGLNIVVTREGDQLFGQATGQGRFRMYAKDAYEFYLRVVEARIVFQRDSGGKVTAMTLYQNGQEITGEKIR